MSTKFVVVGAPRTGSTLLVKTLNTLDNVCCHGELLAELVRGYEDGFDLMAASKSERDARIHRLVQERNRNPSGFIQSALNTANAAAGFKVLYRDLINPRWSEVTDSLLALPSIKFIHLSRLNSLRRYISEQILQSGGPNHSGAGGNSEKRVKIHIDIDAYLRNTVETAAEARHTVALLSGQAVLDISYEELSADTTATVARVGRFLGLDIAATQIKPALKKVGAADLSEAVSNYQELLEHPATRALALMD